MTSHAESLDLNLRHLRALCAVAASGSIAAAAEELYRVSSAVTRSIAELEAALQRPLFERHARGTVLNAYGQLVLVRALRIDAEFEAARTQLMARGGVKGSTDANSLFASILNGRRLAVVASLADRRNMAAVAREFGITQPAVSAALKDLETRLGVPLFERTARGLAPTQAGQIVAFYFRRVLAELRNIVPDIAASEGVLTGSVHVGALPLGRTHILPLAIAALLDKHPGLHIATEESPYDALAASLRSGDLDFILGALRPGELTAELTAEPLFEDRLSLIVRAGHPLSRVTQGLEALSGARWVLSRRGAPSRELFEQCFAASGLPAPVPAVETGDLAVLRALLLESDMVTAISAHQLRYEILDGSLVELAIPLGSTRRQIGLTQREDCFPSPGARALMQEIRRVVADAAVFRRPGGDKVYATAG